MRKLDSHTVEFRLKRPDASFLWHLATHYASVMSAEYAAKLAQNDRQELIDRQPVVELGGQGIDNQAAADLLRVEGVDLTAHAINEAAIANIRVRRQRWRGKSLPVQHTYRCQERRQFQAHSFFLIIEQGSILLILNNIYHHLIAHGDNISEGCVGYLTN